MTTEHLRPTQTGATAARRHIFQSVLTGLVFAAAGVALSLQTLAGHVLPHILNPGTEVEFQEVFKGRPVPHLMDWSYSQIGFLYSLKDKSAPWLIGAGALILGSLWMVCVFLLNPTFRPLYRPIDEPADLTGHSPDSEEPAETLHEIQDQSELGVGALTTADSGPAQQSLEAHSGTGQHNISFDRVHLEQAVRLLVVVGLPVFAVWYVTGGFGNDPMISSGHHTLLGFNRDEFLRYVALGIGLFVGFSQSGLAGRFGILHQAYQTEESAVPERAGVNAVECVKLAAAGCLFALAICMLNKIAVGPPNSDLLDRLQALGTFNRYRLAFVARPFVISAAIVWFSAGIIIYSLGRPGLHIGTRMAMLAVPLLAAVALNGLKRPLTQIETRYDATDAVLASAMPYDPRRPTASVPAGKVAGIEFARRVPVKEVGDQPAPGNDLVLFDPRGTFDVEVDAVTDDGLITDHAKVPDVEAFLKRRDYQSALSWVAIKYIFNDANLRFDSSAEIRAGLDDLEHTPHMLNVGDTVRSLLFLCAASPQNLALLDEYADESRFSHPTRDSLRMMGALYTRFGEVNKATYWYKRADMPASFMHQLQTERPLYHTGSVTGKLLWNGIPLKGARVGAVPQRLNGLPRDLRPAILHYDGEIAAGTPDPSPFFSPYHPRPYHLRWICGGTTTANDGSFTIDHLTEGEYFLVCLLPSGVKLTVPLDPRLTVKNAPPAFTLSYDYPKHDLGVIGLSFRP